MTQARERSLKLLNHLTQWALYVMRFALPFSKSAIEICAIIAITCWLCKKFLLGRDGLKLADTGLNIPIAVFYIISFLSIFWSTHPDISVSAFWRKLTEYILLFFIVAETVNDERIVRNIIAAMALSVFIVCADGIYQSITGYDLIRGYPLHSLERITGPFRFPNGLSAWLLVVSFPLISLSFFYKENTALKAAKTSAIWRICAST